jgi:hypothetical protein
MLRSNPIVKLIARLLLAGILIFAVVGFAGRSLAPSVPLLTSMLWCAAFLGAFLVLSIPWPALNLYLRQWVFRQGGTGPQVFWFNAKIPPSVACTRAKATREQTICEVAMSF